MMTRSQHADLAAEVAAIVVNPEQTAEQLAAHILDMVQVLRQIMVDSTISQQELHEHIQFATELQKAYIKRGMVLQII